MASIIDKETRFFDRKGKFLFKINRYGQGAEEYTSPFNVSIDFENEECYVEVKGVTLIVDGEARFPDAPTERGAKHLKELIKPKKEGNRCAVFFLIQHPAGNFFRPNWENDPVFSQTLNDAYDEGVEILVYRCDNKLSGIEFIPESLDFDLGQCLSDGIIDD